MNDCPATFAECRAAARSVRQAEHARAVINTVRPRGISWLLRSRVPLPLVFYIAARDGRLVWRDTETLALLQPPEHRRLGRGSRAIAWGWIEHAWDQVLFGAPLFAVMLSLVILVPIARLTSGEPMLSIWLVELLGAAYWMALLLAATGVRLILAVVRFMSGRDRPSGTDRLDEHYWTLALVHAAPESLEVLLQRVGERFEGMIDIDVHQRGKVHADQRILICLRGGGTTTETRRVVAGWASRPPADADAAYTVRKERDVPIRLRPTSTDSGRNFPWFVVIVAVAMLPFPHVIASSEREACGESCDGRPTTYGAALRWLAYRLVFDEPNDLHATSRLATWNGWLASCATVVIAVGLVIATLRYQAYRRDLHEQFKRTVDVLYQQSRVLILVANQTERDAVFAAVAEATGATPIRQFGDPHTVFDLGSFERTDLQLAQTRQASIGPGSAGDMAALIARVSPDYLIMVGICYGLCEEWQQLGDVLIASQVRLIDHRYLGPAASPGGSAENRQRGDSVSTSAWLQDRCESATLDWRGAKVWPPGPMLTSSTLLNDPEERAKMKGAHPEALGGEMEAAGVYTAARGSDVNWILIKAISDWGHDKRSDWREPAARNAADFLVHLVRTGALNNRPTRHSTTP